MRPPSFPSRWTRRQRVRRSMARRRRAVRQQRHTPAIGRGCPTLLADGFGGSACDEPIGAAGTGADSVPASAAFVELPLLTPLTECTIELERASGLRIKVRLQGPSAAQVLALGQWLWSAGR